MQENFCLTFGKTGNIITTDEKRVSVSPTYMTGLHFFMKKREEWKQDGREKQDERHAGK